MVGLGGGFGELDLVAEGLELTQQVGSPLRKFRWHWVRTRSRTASLQSGRSSSVRTLTKFRERREVIAVDIVEREREDPEPGVAFLACGNGLPLVVLDAGCNPTGTRRR